MCAFTTARTHAHTHARARTHAHTTTESRDITAEKRAQIDLARGVGEVLDSWIRAGMPRDEGIPRDMFIYVTVKEPRGQRRRLAERLQNPAARCDRVLFLFFSPPLLRLLAFFLFLRSFLPSLPFRFRSPREANGGGAVSIFFVFAGPKRAREENVQESLFSSVFFLFSFYAFFTRRWNGQRTFAFRQLINRQ